MYAHFLVPRDNLGETLDYAISQKQMGVASKSADVHSLLACTV